MNLVQWFEEPSVSLAVHVSPEGRSSEVAGRRLARRDNGQWFEEPSSSLAAGVSPEGRSSEVAGRRLARRDNVQWSMVNGQRSMVYAAKVRCHAHIYQIPCLRKAPFSEHFGRVFATF